MTRGISPSTAYLAFVCPDCAPMVRNEASRGLTLNESTPYMFGFTNVAERPVVFDIPPGLVISLTGYFWQQSLFDLGVFGVNEGEGGRYVVVGPDTPDHPDVEGATRIEHEQGVHRLPSRRDSRAERGGEGRSERRLPGRRAVVRDHRRRLRLTGAWMRCYTRTPG